MGHSSGDATPSNEPDLPTGDDSAALHHEIEAGRRSAAAEPLRQAQELYRQVREALSRP